MKSFFLNTGPHNINKLLKNTFFTEKKKIKDLKIQNVSNLADANKGDITFLESIKYLTALKTTKASICILEKKFLNFLNPETIPVISSNPLLDFIVIAKIFYPDADKDNYKFKQHSKYKNFVKQNTLIDSSTKIGKNFNIGINSTLKKNIVIGDNVKIGSNCVISNAIIGHNVSINDGSVIGKIGYGFKYINNNLNFIPHIGHVKIKNNVYIGSNCSIDRGSFSNTEIGENTMIDNQVHIAHNVKIGSFCLIAGQVGIAGSSQIGNNCKIGGQAGISGHLTIGNNVSIGGHSGVLRNVNDNQILMGFPAVGFKEFLKRNKK